MAETCKVATWVSQAQSAFGRQLIADTARAAGVTEAQIWHRVLKNIDEFEAATGCHDIGAHESALMVPPPSHTTEEQP